jgi:hypothetical protein
VVDADVVAKRAGRAVDKYFFLVGGRECGGSTVIPVFDESSLRYPIGGGKAKREEWLGDGGALFRNAE